MHCCKRQAFHKFWRRTTYLFPSQRQWIVHYQSPFLCSFSHVTHVSALKFSFSPSKCTFRTLRRQPCRWNPVHLVLRVCCSRMRLSPYELFQLLALTHRWHSMTSTKPSFTTIILSFLRFTPSDFSFIRVSGLFRPNSFRPCCHYRISRTLP